VNACGHSCGNSQRLALVVWAIRCKQKTVLSVMTRH
jgi:hypothetical protein